MERYKLVRPIVLMDEPQKIEGTANKKSQSLKAIDEVAYQSLREPT